MRLLLSFILLFVTILSANAYNDPYGYCSDLVSYERQLVNHYNLSQYIQTEIHKIVQDFIKDCEKDNPGDIAGEMFRNVAMSRMKDMAEKFHRDEPLDLLQNFQNATWFDLGYPEKIGSAGNYMLRTDLGFNRRYDCIVLHEVVSPVGALAHNPLRVIDGTKYIIEEFSFYDNFSRFGEGNRYFVSSNGYIIYTERLYEEDYLFNATQFDSTTPYYSKLIKAIKKINHID